jgi:hypothetical protein
MLIQCTTPKVLIPTDGFIAFLAKSAGAIFDTTAMSFISHVNDQKNVLNSLNAPLGTDTEVKDALAMATTKVAAAKSQVKNLILSVSLSPTSISEFWLEVDWAVNKYKSNMSYLAGGLVRHIDGAFNSLNAALFDAAMDIEQ